MPTEGGLRASVEEFAREEAGAGEAGAGGGAGSLPPAVACTGWEMHHDIGVEKPIDLSRPLLAQRSRWHRNSLYDKPLLVRSPLSYALGFHTCACTGHGTRQHHNLHTPAVAGDVCVDMCRAPSHGSTLGLLCCLVASPPIACARATVTTMLP